MTPDDAMKKIFSERETVDFAHDPMPQIEYCWYWIRRNKELSGLDGWYKGCLQNR